MNKYTFRVYNHKFNKYQTYEIYADTKEEAQRHMEWITRGLPGDLINVVYGARKH